MDIQLENLSYSYNRKTSVLSDINTTITPGVTILMGENGVGKTTLLHILAGMRYATEGRCIYAGDGDARFRLPSVLSKVFYSGIDVEVPAKDIRELVRIHAQFYPDFSSEQLAANLADFGIEQKMPFARMSLGTRRKAETAYALSLNTAITLLDEPANGFDIESKALLRNMIARNLKPEQSLIISTHNFADIDMLVDAVMVLSQRRLLLSATVDDILGRVSFTSTTLHPENAVYSELYAGRWQSIVPADDADSSDINLRLLYMALHSPEAAQTLISLIRKPENI